MKTKLIIVGLLIIWMFLGHVYGFMHPEWSIIDLLGLLVGVS